MILGVTFVKEFNGALGFDLDYDLQGHLKVKSIFLNRTPYFLPRKWKERKILSSNMVLTVFKF